MSDNNDSSNNDPPEIDPEDLKLDQVVGMETDDLTDTHKEFLEENKGNLTDDQKVKFGLDKEEEESEGDEGDEGKEDDEGDEEEGKEIDPNKVKIRVKRKTVKEIKKVDPDDEDDPDDVETITKIVGKETAGIKQSQQEFKDQQAIDALIANTPELKKYRAVALKYMKDSSWNNISASSVMKVLSAEDQQAIGARKEREAAKKARDTRSGGSSVRPVSSKAKD